MRPGNATLLPVSTASTGLLCLLVGAHVHHVRSDTEVSVWLLPHEHRIQCVTYTFLRGPLCITLFMGTMGQWGSKGIWILDMGKGSALRFHTHIKH